MQLLFYEDMKLMLSTTRICIVYCFVGLLYLLPGYGQQLNDKFLAVPPRYNLLKIADTLQIDGQAKEAAWSKAAWIAPFKHIVDGSIMQRPEETRVKMLWNDEYLYLYVEFKEQHLWATLQQHDSGIFQENAFEVFIDPDGDNQHYLEFQINALGTVWDLLMTKPYRNGGRSLSDWDVKGLKKAVHLMGSLNQPADQDEGWSVELAFPLKNITMGMRAKPVPGNIWRMNLSRVAWQLKVQNGVYVKEEDAEGKVLEPDYWVWAPMGMVNLHMPECWGYLILADEKGNTMEAENHLDSLEIARKLVWKVYYLQENYKRDNGGFAADLATLNKAFPKDTIPDDLNLSMEANAHQFLIAYAPTEERLLMAVDQDGKVFFEWP